MWISADAGNNDMMLRRKVRMSFKQLKQAFRDVQGTDGVVTLRDVEKVLHRYDIDLAAQQLADLWKATGATESGVKWVDVLAYYYRDSDDY